jgi:predicted dehydrogenase
MADMIRWGILGLGNIAKQFATGLQAVPDAELVACGSRAQASADKFGDQFDVPRRHASYADLANDPDVDAIYVATPHDSHKENSILCMRAGKAVLCEKPFAINAGETEKMIAVANETGQFLMEAMWTRYLPAHVQVRAWLEAGAIGDVRMFTGDFGFRTDINAEGRLFNPQHGGGALLDVGIYPISYASMVFGRQPNRITGMAEFGETKVDEQSAVIFGYDQGEMAVCSTAIRTNTPQEGRILGTDGMILLHAPFWRGEKVTLCVDGKDDETHEFPLEGNGYNYEAVEVGRCLREGLKESALMTLDESLGLMQTLDTIRGQWGLRYPADG